MKEILKTLQIEVEDTKRKIQKLQDSKKEFESFGDRGKIRIKNISCEIRGMKTVLKKLESVISEIELALYIENK